MYLKTLPVHVGVDALHVHGMGGGDRGVTLG